MLYVPVGLCLCLYQLLLLCLAEGVAGYCALGRALTVPELALEATATAAAALEAAGQLGSCAARRLGLK